MKNYAICVTRFMTVLCTMVCTLLVGVSVVYKGKMHDAMWGKTSTPTHTKKQRVWVWKETVKSFFQGKIYGTAKSLSSVSSEIGTNTTFRTGSKQETFYDRRGGGEKGRKKGILFSLRAIKRQHQIWGKLFNIKTKVDSEREKTIQTKQQENARSIVIENI